MVKVIDKKIENEFVEKVNSTYKACVGYETFGQVTEFYDEDGAVLMRSTAELDGKIVFEFPDSNSLFEYEEVLAAEDEE